MVFHNYTLSENTYEVECVETAKKRFNVFVPARDILQVILFETYSEFCEAHAGNMRSGCSRINMIRDICTIERQPCCSCGVLEKFDQFEDSFDLDVIPLHQFNRELDKADASAKDCICDFKVFPLYEIIVQNNIGERMTEGRDGFRKIYVPKTVTYIIHSSEREHMERYLAGTDDPLYDYVHHLKYNPANGSEALAAREDFEMHQKAGKRQKLENSQI